MIDREYQERLEIVAGEEPRISDYQERLEIVAKYEPDFSNIIRIEIQAANFFYHLMKRIRTQIAFKDGVMF